MMNSECGMCQSRIEDFGLRISGLSWGNHEIHERHQGGNCKWEMENRKLELVISGPWSVISALGDASASLSPLFWQVNYAPRGQGEAIWR
jgi:hypothetical protein